jgi:hypothetical protein
MPLALPADPPELAPAIAPALPPEAPVLLPDAPLALPPEPVVPPLPLVAPVPPLDVSSDDSPLLQADRTSKHEDANASARRDTREV